MSAVAVCACACVLVCACVWVHPYISVAFLPTTTLASFTCISIGIAEAMVVDVCVRVYAIWVYARATRSCVFVSFICVDMPLLKERLSIFVHSLFCHTQYVYAVDWSVDVRTPVHCIVQYRTRYRHIVQYARSLHSQHTHTHTRDGKHKTRLQYIQSEYMYAQIPISQPADQLLNGSMCRLWDFPASFSPFWQPRFLRRSPWNSLHCQNAGEDRVFPSRQNEMTESVFVAFVLVCQKNVLGANSNTMLLVAWILITSILFEKKKLLSFAFLI